MSEQNQQQKLKERDIVIISPTWKKDKPNKATISNDFGKTLDAYAKYQTRFEIHKISQGLLYGLTLYNLRELDKKTPMDKAIYDGMLIKVEEGE